MSDLSSLDTEYAIDPMDEDVVCFFCKHLPFQPKEITCKCALIGCNECWTKWFDQKRQCPQCASSPAELRGSGLALRKISSMRAKCQRHELGCTFICLIGFNGSTYLKHANVDCLFQTTICSQCHEPLLKKEEDKHKTETCAERLTTCTYCKCQLKFSELDKHRSVENKSLGCVNQIHCPNRCLDEKKEITTIKRTDVDAHRNICPLEMVPCEVCSVFQLRCMMNSHMTESLVQHTERMNQQLATFKTKVSDLSPLALEVSMLKNTVAAFTDRLRMPLGPAFEHRFLNVSSLNGLKGSLPFTHGGYILRLVLERAEEKDEKDVIGLFLSVENSLASLPLPVVITYDLLICDAAQQTSYHSRAFTNIRFSNYYLEGLGAARMTSLSQLEKAKIYKKEVDTITCGVYIRSMEAPVPSWISSSLKI